jgi:Predicted membrane protein
LDGRSSTGLEIRIAAMLCYALGFITGLIFLAVEKDSRFVKFHALQSTLLFTSLIIMNIVFSFIPLIGWFFNMLLIPLMLVCWVVCMLLALQEKKFLVPIIGPIAYRESSRF